MTLTEIEALICKRHNCTSALLRSKCKNVKIGEARAEFSWLAHNDGFSYPAMGKYLGKDHTTMLQAARRWDRIVGFRKHS